MRDSGDQTQPTSFSDKYSPICFMASTQCTDYKSYGNIFLSKPLLSFDNNFIRINLRYIVYIITFIMDTNCYSLANSSSMGDFSWWKK